MSNSTPKSNTGDDRIPAAILCGGQSRRMGRSKANLPFGDVTMLAHITQRITIICDPLILVAAHPTVETEPLPNINNAVCVHDAQPNRGPLEGLLAALKQASSMSCPSVFVISCDSPLINPQVVQHLIDSLGSFDASVPQGSGHLYPLLAAYNVCVIPAIEEMLANGQLRVLELMDRINVRFVDSSELKSVDPNLNSLLNVNCKEDYVASLRKAGITE